MNKNIKYFASYLSTIKNLSNTTIDAYVSDLSLIDNYLEIKGKTLLTASNKDVSEYLSGLNLKNKSYNRKITTLTMFYKYLSKEKIDYKLNVEKLYHVKNEKVYPRIITFDDIKKMIEVQSDNLSGQRNKVIIMLLYITGLRVSELVNLTYSDINLKDGYIRCVGKGNKEKIVEVGDLLGVTLGNYNNVVRPKILNGLISNYLFVGAEGEPLTRQTIYDIINSSASKANIKLNVTPHTLRHCFATHMLENGADLRSVQEMLGHADIKTTQIYLNIQNETIKNEYYTKFKDPLKRKENENEK